MTKRLRNSPIFSSVRVGRCAMSTMCSFRSRARYMTRAVGEVLSFARDAAADARASGRGIRGKRAGAGAPTNGAPANGMSDAAALGRTAAVVGLRRHVLERADLEAGGRERADRGLAARARALDEDVDLLDTVLLRLAGSGLRGHAGGVRRRLARALEAHAARRRPADDGARRVGDRDDRVVERRLDVGLAQRDVLLLLAARLARGGLGLCHVLALLNPGGRALARLLLAGDGALRTLAGTRVRLRALPAHREAAAVAQALVGTDLDLAADVGGDLATEVALHLVVAFDVVAESDELVVGEVLDADVLVDLRRREDLVRAGTAHAVDVREGDHHALVARDVNAGKTCHAVLLRVSGGVEQDRCPGLRPRCPPRTGSDPA